MSNFAQYIKENVYFICEKSHVKNFNSHIYLCIYFFLFLFWQNCNSVKTQNEKDNSE